ncbi:MAG: Holliday junction resolvase RuvX [Deltaproteobacteria bacterium]|nr:Holliday junction resolvase RuvX [Deltaproteobacteria bacterium]
MKIMGIDLGSKTIGIAVSDELEISAHGVKVIQRIGINRDIEEIAKFAEENSVEEIVVGLPVNMNGTIGQQAEKVLNFVKRLRGKLNIPVATWDERLSTVAVTKVLIEGSVKRKNRKNVIDKVAAVYILQGYLDSR